MSEIVILDGHTSNPGDLSWSELENYGKLTVYPRSSPDEMLFRIGDAEMAITNKCYFSRELLAKLPKLKYIGLTSTGTNAVDLEAAREYGISVSNVPAYSTMSVAQHTFALLLEMTNNVGAHSVSVHNGDWENSADFCYWRTPIIELDKMVMGIIGFGQIGRAVADIAQAFGMSVIVYAPRPVDLPQTIAAVDLKTLFKNSDVVSLHCPLNKDTEKIINQDNLLLMKKGSYIINTGRGGLVDEQAVAGALADGILAGFAADVLSSEPPSRENPLLRLANSVITPHVAWVSIAARKRLINEVVANLSAYKTGKQRNIVN